MSSLRDKPVSPGVSGPITQMAQECLASLLVASTRGDDVECRRTLRFWVHQARDAGFSLNLSNDMSTLGRVMAEANKRSRAFGWL